MRPVCLGLSCCALCVLAPSPEPAVTIALFDIAGLRPEIREAMKTEASRIFVAAGVDLKWVECEVAGNPMNLAECAAALGPARLMLQLFPGVNKEKPKAAGFAVLQGGSGVFACVYPERVKELARDAKWDFGDLLGHAAAHELGHLLLRSSAHAGTGIMRANWETEDLRRLSHAGLVFLPREIRAIHNAIRLGAQGKTERCSRDPCSGGQ